MFCIKCGELISDDSLFCPKCGTRVNPNNETVFTNNDSTVVDTVMGEVVTPPPLILQSNKKKRIVLGVIIVITIAIIGIAAFLAIQAAGKSELKNQLLRGWDRVEESDGTYYILVLNFSENEIEYNFESPYYSWLDSTLATMEYEVISPNKIKVLDHNKIVEIEFNDERTMMTCTPAITSTDVSESWYHLD